MAVYAVVSVEVHDPEEYAKYAAIAGPAIEAAGGRFLARGGHVEVMEGEARSRNVIAEFPDMETAKAFYHGAEYQRALKHGIPAADRTYIFVEGV